MTDSSMSSSVEAGQSGRVFTYYRRTSVLFRKTKGEFGGLSNMAAGFSLEVNGTTVRTSEALYQACRFPHRPELQRQIIEQRSPMTAKMVGKPYTHDSRRDWDSVRVEIMRWCLRVKLAQNWEKFSKLLLATGDRPIVEDSRRDDFWGAIRVDSEILSGMNILGRLLVELREQLKCDPRPLMHVEPLQLSHFQLVGKSIGRVAGHTESSTVAPIHVAVAPSASGNMVQTSFFDENRDLAVDACIPGNKSRPKSNET